MTSGGTAAATAHPRGAGAGSDRAGRLPAAELATELWERTVGRAADRALDDHLRAAVDHLGDAVDVLDLGAGRARALDRLGRLDVPVVSYLGIERDTALVAASRRRTGRHPAAVVVRGDVEGVIPASSGRRLVLLTWVLSSTCRPGQVVDRARELAGHDGVVVVAAVTVATDRATSLDAWIRRRWRVSPIDPTVLARGATRLDVTLRGRAIVATLAGRRLAGPARPGLADRRCRRATVEGSPLPRSVAAPQPTVPRQ